MRDIYSGTLLFFTAQNNMGPPGFLSLFVFIPLTRKGCAMANDNLPLSKLTLIDAVAQLCKHFAVPTLLFALSATRIPSIPPTVQNGIVLPLDLVWMLFLWCLACDAWFLLARHWRDLLNAGTSCMLSFFSALGSVLDGAAGSAVASIMKGVSPLLSLILVAMVIASAYSWIESTVPEATQNALGAIALVCIIIAVLFAPLSTLIGDIKAIAATLR